MLNRLRQLFSGSKPHLTPEARELITSLEASGVWILAIGVRGTPALPSLTDSDSVSRATKVVAGYRKPLPELGDDDSVFPFNFKQEGRQILPFFSSEECARDFLADSGFRCDLSPFQPFCLRAGFVAAPENEKFDLILDLRSSSERRIEDAERQLLRSLSTASE